LQLEAADAQPVIFPFAMRRPCQVWSRSTYLLLSYNVFTCWYLTLRCDLDLDL